MKDYKFLKDIKKLKEYKITLPLGSKKVSNENSDFNFFQPYIGVYKQKRSKNLYITLTAATLASVFVISFICNYIKIDNTEHDIDKIKKIIDSPQTKITLDEAEKVKKKYDALNKYYAQANSITSAIQNKDIISSKLMTDICSNIPSKISFKSFNVTVGQKGVGGNIEIQGTADSRVSIAEFQHNVKALEKIKEVQVSNITKLNIDEKGDSTENKDDNVSPQYSFTIKCTLKDVDEYEDK